MDDDATQWEIPPRIIRAISKAGLRTCNSILTLSVGEIQRLTQLSESDCKLLTKIASEKVLVSGIPYHSALQLLSRRNCHPLAIRKVTTCGCPVIDRFLRGGILVPGLTEIVGESSSGKTQFCLQLSLAVQLPSDLGGLHGGAVYICTEGSFPTKRFQQLLPFFENRLKKHRLEPISFSDNVYVEHAMTVEELQVIVNKALPKLLSRHNIRLVIIDSVAALFRSEFDFKDGLERASQMYKFGSQLLMYSTRYGAGFVCINQVSDALDSRLFDIQQGERNIVKSVVPALGLTWSSVVNVRLIMSRCEYLYKSVENNSTENQSLQVSNRSVSQLPVIRKLKVLLAPHLRTSECFYLVQGDGIQGIENAEEFISSQIRSN